MGIRLRFRRVHVQPGIIPKHTLSTQDDTYFFPLSEDSAREKREFIIEKSYWNVFGDVLEYYGCDFAMPHYLEEEDHYMPDQVLVFQQRLQQISPDMVRTATIVHYGKYFNDNQINNFIDGIVELFAEFGAFLQTTVDQQDILRWGLS